MKKKILVIGIFIILISMLVILTGCNTKNKKLVTKVGNLELEVQDISEFSDGLAMVVKDNKYGFIDKNGNIVIDCKYTSALSFFDGLAKVYTDDYGNFEFINTKGKTILAGKEIVNKND